MLRTVSFAWFLLSCCTSRTRRGAWPQFLRTSRWPSLADRNELKRKAPPGLVPPEALLFVSAKFLCDSSVTLSASNVAVHPSSDAAARNTRDSRSHIVDQRILHTPGPSKALALRSIHLGQRVRRIPRRPAALPMPCLLPGRPKSLRAM